jgi:hypothetical protein
MHPRFLCTTDLKDLENLLAFIEVAWKRIGHAATAVVSHVVVYPSLRNYITAMSVLLCVASLAEILSSMAFFTLHKVYHLSHAPIDYRLQGVETILTEKDARRRTFT